MGENGVFSLKYSFFSGKDVFNYIFKGRFCRNTIDKNYPSGTQYLLTYFQFLIDCIILKAKKNDSA